MTHLLLEIAGKWAQSSEDDAATMAVQHQRHSIKGAAH